MLETDTQNKYRRPAIAVAVITSFIMPFMGNALNLSVPGVSEEFGVSAETVGWMVTAYMLPMAGFSVPFGRIADITSHRNVLIVGAVVFACACTAAAFAWSMTVLIVTRVIQGIGSAMILGCNIPLLIKSYPPQMRGKALGISIGAVYVGGACGPVIGGVLNHQLGWRSIFVFAVILVIIALVIAAAKLPNVRSEGAGQKMDYVGSIVFVFFIALFMLGLSKIEAGLLPALIMGAGLAIGIIFVYYEAHREDPVLNIYLFRSNIGYSMSSLAALLNYSATSAIAYLLSIYMQVIQGYSSQTAGLVMIAQPIVMAVLTPKMGKMSDKHSPFKLSSLGMCFCAVGILMFLFINKETEIVYIIGALAVTGLGFAFFSSPNTNAILSCVEKKDYGAANAVVSTMRSIGQAAGMVIVTIVVSFMLPGTQLEQAEPEKLLEVIRISFIIFAVLCVVGIFISLLRKKK